MVGCPQLQVNVRGYPKRDLGAAGRGYNPARIGSAMNLSFEQTLIEVWRQALVQDAKTVELGTQHFPVRRTPRCGLRQVDFVFDGNEIRAGAEPGHEIAVAADGAVGQEGDAVPQRGALRGKRRGWESEPLRSASRIKLSSLESAMAWPLR